MNTKPPPTDPERSTASRRRLVSWVSGIGIAGFGGAIVTPLTNSDLVTAGRGPRGRRGHDRWPRPSRGPVRQGSQFRGRGRNRRGQSLPRTPGWTGDVRNPAPPARRSLTGATDGPGVECRLVRGAGRELYPLWESPSMVLQPDGVGGGLDVCPRDGSRFDPYRGGQPIAGQASRPLPRVGVARTVDARYEITTGVHRTTEGD